MQAEQSKYLKVERARTEISPDGPTVPMGSLLLEAVVELPNHHTPIDSINDPQWETRTEHEIETVG